MFYYFGILNSNIISDILKIIAPTMNYEAIQISSLPLIKNDEHKESVVVTTKNNIEISKQDWNSFETSWNFKKHPLIEFK